jgi:hypothetical protein
LASFFDHRIQNRIGDATFSEISPVGDFSKFSLETRTIASPEKDEGFAFGMIGRQTAL